jgi:hypothetical protein
MTDVPPLAPADFRKSSRSEADKECVEVARRPDWSVVRDSKTQYGAAEDRRLSLHARPAAAFFAAVKGGQFG